MANTIMARPLTEVATTHRPLSTLFGSIYRESRPGVQLVFLLRSSASSGLLRHPGIHSSLFVVGWLFVTVSIYVFNGITDLTADVANQSSRPLASRQLGVVEAAYACVACAGAGVLVCAAVSFREAAIAAAMLLLGWAYSAGPAYKNAPAGFAIVIGLGAGLTYVGGWVAGGSTGSIPLVVVVWIAAWVGLCCSSKDFSDITGDRLAGRRTWPVVFGPHRAAGLLSLLALTASGGFLVTSIRLALPIAPAAVIAIGSVALAISALRSGNERSRKQRRRPYRFFMSTQYLANVSMIAI